MKVYYLFYETIQYAAFVRHRKIDIVLSLGFMYGVQSDSASPDASDSLNNEEFGL